MVGQSEYCLDALADFRVLEDVDRLIFGAEPVEDRDRAARKAALREQRGALHEQHHVVALDDVADAVVCVTSLQILHCRHCGFELQCVKLTPYSPAKRGIDRLVLPDAAQAFEASADDARRIMVAVAGKIADRHLGVGDRGPDQPLDLVRRPSASDVRSPR